MKAEGSFLKVMMLCDNGFSSRVMFNAINYEFPISLVVIEDSPSSLQVLKRRVVRLGLFVVLGQILFILFNKILLRLNRSYILKLKAVLELDDSNIPTSVLQYVTSINDDTVKEMICNYSPDVVIVNGTRIISKEVLSCSDALFVNTHAGITPKYRGVHGGYWALVNNDRDNCGVTVHLVDSGIDTGGILYQARIFPTVKDNFNTYPILQVMAAIPLMKQVLCDIQAGILTQKKVDLPSCIWSHPTIFEYIKGWVLKGVR